MESVVDVPALAKGLSLCVGALVIVCSLIFMTWGTYLGIVVGLETIFFACTVLVVEVQTPEVAIARMRQSAPFLLTIPGQLLVCVLMILFLFGMGAFGITMAFLVLLTLGVNGYAMQTYPDDMPQRLSSEEPGAGQPADAYSPAEDGGGTQLPPYGTPYDANSEYDVYAAPKYSPAPSTQDL